MELKTGYQSEQTLNIESKLQEFGKRNGWGEGEKIFFGSVVKGHNMAEIDVVGNRLEINREEVPDNLYQAVANTGQVLKSKGYDSDSEIVQGVVKGMRDFAEMAKNAGVEKVKAPKGFQTNWQNIEEYVDESIKKIEAGNI